VALISVWDGSVWVSVFSASSSESGRAFWLAVGGQPSVTGVIVVLDFSGLLHLLGEDTGRWGSVNTGEVSVDTLRSITWWEFLLGEDTGGWGGVDAGEVSVDSL
jgi:hypothetical protein